MKRLALILITMLGLAGLASAQSAATQELVRQAQTAYEDGKFDKAAAYYDRAIAGEPKGVPADAYGLRAAIFVVKKDFAGAVRWIDSTAQAAWPNDDSILQWKVVALQQIPGRQKDAIELAEKISARSPSKFVVQKIVGDHYYTAGGASADKAVKAYENFFRYRTGELAKTDYLTMIKLGNSYLQLGKNEEAEKQFADAERKMKADTTVAGNARKGLCASYAGAHRWDRAITLCEQVIRDKLAMRGDPSPYFNIGLAYLEKGQFANALSAANSYIAANPRGYKGYLLRGRIFNRQVKFNEADGQYLKAAELAPGNSDVARWQGRNFLDQKKPKKAIEALAKAIQANPNALDIRMDLGEAYLADGQGANAATQAEQALKLAPAAQQGDLHGLAGRGHYAAGDLGAARGSFEKAIAASADSKKGSWRKELVKTLNRQAADKFRKNDLPGAEALLRSAHEMDAGSNYTNFNLGLLAIEKAKWSEAIELLGRRLEKNPNDLLTNRLIARAYLGAKNTEKAVVHYAAAEAEARKLRNLPVLAEVYTEWGPLLLQAGKLDEAVDKLEQAAQYAVNQPFAQATQRNYQVALFRRGYERLRSNKGDAVADLEGATRFPNLLVGNEEDVFTFALGLAYLDAGQSSKATGIFQGLSKKSGAGWLKAPWDKVGADFFVAYALYREGSAGSRGKASPVFERLVGKATGSLGGKVKDLLRSTQEYLAFDAYARGAARDADAALKKADAYAAGGNKAAIEHNRAVLDMEKNATASRATFERVKDRVPEALVNLGILADRAGDAKTAYDLWTEAKSKGVRSGKLDEWITAKKRIFGF